MIITGKITKKHLAAINFFADQLLTKQVKKHIILNVIFRKKFDFLGLTAVDEYNTRGLPREFTVEIYRNQTEKEILITLAHEIVHVAQYCKGHLNEQMTVWRGQKIEKEIEYDNQPWEKEADELSLVLYEQYRREFNE